MIKYTLKCGKGHEFESWFRDSPAFDALQGAGALSCAECGGTDISKSIMAPRVTTSRAKAAAPTPAPVVSAPPGSPAMQALRKLREHIRQNTDYVGKSFADEARRIHEGEAEERAIWGEATPEDARALIEDGIPVAPLPPIIRQDD